MATSSVLSPPLQSAAGGTSLDGSSKHGYRYGSRHEPRGYFASDLPRFSQQSVPLSSARHNDSNPASLVAGPFGTPQPPTHAKLHKRNGSGVQVPTGQSSAANAVRQTSGPRSKGTSTQDVFFESPALPPVEEKSKTKTKMKPLLRKLTAEDSKNSIDLSRSTVENEGLGIYTDLDRDKRQVDPTYAPYERRSGHVRSTSGASQFSSTTVSSNNKPGSQYVHPMRQTPRPYTPPVAQAYQASPVGRVSVDNNRSTFEPDAQLRQPSRVDSPHLSSVSSSQGHRSSLRPRTDSLSELPPSHYSNSSDHQGVARADGRLDTLAPISRTSLDKTLRNRTRTNTDPAVRTANIAAARAAFEEKEAAKARKVERQQMKYSDREKKKQDKKDQEVISKVEKVNSGSLRTSNEKPLRGTEYSSIPAERMAHGGVPPGPKRTSSTKKETVNMWVLFMTWLRTRLFKTKKKVKRATQDPRI